MTEEGVQTQDSPRTTGNSAFRSVPRRQTTGNDRKVRSLRPRNPPDHVSKLCRTYTNSSPGYSIPSKICRRRIDYYVYGRLIPKGVRERFVTLVRKKIQHEQNVTTERSVNSILSYGRRWVEIVDTFASVVQTLDMHKSDFRPHGLLCLLTDERS